MKLPEGFTKVVAGLYANETHIVFKAKTGGWKANLKQDFYPTEDNPVVGFTRPKAVFRTWEEAVKFADQERVLGY